jgi:DNA-binding transcriptional LysR family regulator
VLPTVIRQWHRDFAKSFVVLECGETARLVELVRQHQLDLAIGVEPQSGEDLEVRPFFQDELLFAFSAEHPWADGRVLSPQEVAKQPLLLHSRTSQTSQLITRFFADQQIELSGLMEVRSSATLAELVKLNVAAAVLAPWVFGEELTTSAIQMRPLSARGLARRWIFLHRAQGRLGLVEEEFIKICRRGVPSLRLDRKALPVMAPGASPHSPLTSQPGR